MRHAVVIEDAGSNGPAYVPDRPGCVLTAATLSEAEQEIRAAIRLHLDGLMEAGLPVPRATSRAEYVEA